MELLPRPQPEGENEVGHLLYDGALLTLWREAMGVSRAELAFVLKRSRENIFTTYERAGVTGRYAKAMRLYFEGVEKAAKKKAKKQEKARAEYLAAVRE